MQTFNFVLFQFNKWKAWTTLESVYSDRQIHIHVSRLWINVRIFINYDDISHLRPSTPLTVTSSVPARRGVCTEQPVTSTLQWARATPPSGSPSEYQGVKTRGQRAPAGAHWRLSQAWEPASGALGQVQRAEISGIIRDAGFVNWVRAQRGMQSAGVLVNLEKQSRLLFNQSDCCALLYISAVLTAPQN